MIRQWTWEKLCEDFTDKDTQALLHERIRSEGVTDLVVFENQMFDSSLVGQQTAVSVGPGCLLKSKEDCEGKWLNDLPSQRQYPVAFIPRSSAPKEAVASE